MSAPDYLSDIDEAAFHAWLRAEGWTEDTSPETERWLVPAWWHDGQMIARREDWLADDYRDYLFAKQGEGALPDFGIMEDLALFVSDEDLQRAQR